MNRSPTLRGFGFASIPGDPSEQGAFLQKRVRYCTGMGLVIWSIVLVLTTLFNMTLVPEAYWQAHRTRMLVLHLLAVGFMFVLWRLLKRPHASLRFLDLADGGGALAQSVLLTMMMLELPIISRPEMQMLLGVVLILSARAAIVPSTSVRTAVIGVVASLPILLATWLLYRSRSGPPLVLAPVGYVVGAGIWASLIVFSSVVISRVIWGLQSQVAEALRLGQYTLVEKLGEGGMGSVWRAQHALLRRPTAVKLLPPGRTGPAALARFEREVQLTSQLSHPNTIAIYDYGRTAEGVFYYAMEYLDGVDLESVVRHDGPLPPGRVRHLLVQAAGALAEAHATGLVHRDIKPANLLVSERARTPDFLKVVDFGLVKELGGRAGEERVSGVQVLTGTPLYLAPEAITRPNDVDGRADLYSLGAVAYYLLTGTPVFDGSTIIEVCGHHLHSPVEPPSQRTGQPVPASLEALVLQLLEKDPARRPQDADAVVEALETMDDVPRWTAHDARQWWRSRAGAVRTAREEEPSTGTPSRALAVNLAVR